MKRETGACEGLSSDLATHEEIMDKAYAYAYRLQYDQFYRPPVIIFEYMPHTCILRLVIVYETSLLRGYNTDRGDIEVMFLLKRMPRPLGNIPIQKYPEISPQPVLLLVTNEFYTL
jgi:hypothetical protein